MININDFTNRIKNLAPKVLIIASLLILQIILTILMIKIENHIIDNISYIGILIVPFFIMVLLVLDTNWFNRLMKFWTFRVFVYFITIVYIIFSNLYASTEINNIFGISSSEFPITAIILTFKYALTLFFDIIYPLHFLWTMVFGFILIILVFQKKFKVLMMLTVITLYVLIYIGLIIPTLIHKDTIVKQIAYKFDFYKKHNCLKLDNVDSVVFLPNDKVLARYIVPVDKKEFEVMECQK
ncbi:MAG: hypothetical protein RBT59_10735 [Arcobacteraceae bacterium]|jgi:hypothetical protein|nr:hypothetical protein [Arcobacteraceae bacterium]